MAQSRSGVSDTWQGEPSGPRVLVHRILAMPWAVNGGDRGVHGGAWLDDGAEQRLDHGSRNHTLLGQVGNGSTQRAVASGLLPSANLNGVQWPGRLLLLSFDSGMPPPCTPLARCSWRQRGKGDGGVLRAADLL